MPITFTPLLDTHLGLSFPLPPPNPGVPGFGHVSIGPSRKHPTWTSGGEGGAVRSTEPGGGSRHPDRKVPPTPNPSPPLPSPPGGGGPNAPPLRKQHRQAGLGNPNQGGRQAKHPTRGPASAI